MLVSFLANHRICVRNNGIIRLTIVHSQNIECSSIIDQLKCSGSNVFASVIVIYSLIMLFLYQHCTVNADLEKERLSEEYYNKIVEITASEINSVLQKLSINPQTQNVLIRINMNDLEICNEKCINYNLFHFGAVINQYIPKFIHYKIELNKKFLYADFKIKNYQIEKTYHLNKDNQLNISLSIDDAYWNKIKADNLKPFWMVMLFVTFTGLLFYILSKVSFKKFNKSYSLYYQNLYQKELKYIETSLMNKIWNLSFYKEKDLEINCLFAEEANRLALNLADSNDEQSKINDSKLRNNSDNLPCSIPLYQQGKMEEIKVEQLINLFADRFNKENENITVKLTSQVKVVYFVSKAALYQIIYSIISYLIFVINKQTEGSKHNIRIVIDNLGKSIKLRFEYDGLLEQEEIELLKISSCFFKKHANPFILNINQVFDILRINGFSCNVSYIKFNIIDIVQKEEKIEQQITKEDNVILLSSFSKKKK